MVVGVHKLEQRTFIDKKTYENIVQFLEEHATVKESKRQIIYKYRCTYDFRALVEKDRMVLRMRKGNVDEDILVAVSYEDHEKMLDILRLLGHTLDTQWYRLRKLFTYQDLEITLDKTFRYGYVISVSIELPRDQVKDGTEKLYHFFEQFHIVLTSPEQFYQQYHHYLTNWYEYTKDIDDSTFFEK